MSKKILIIDDDPVGTRLIEYSLKQRGYQVLTAQNGVEGLKKAQNEEPALVILDIMLPGMDGFEVCHRLRTEEKTAQLPILILSGRAQQTDRATGFKMGADDYLAKPAAPSEIINRIESVLARRYVYNSRTAVFLSPKEKVGTTTVVVNLAIALSQMGKRVIVVDPCAYNGSISQQLGMKPQDSVSLLEAPIDTLKCEDLESALVVHQTGVSVLRIFETFEKPENMSPSNIDLLFDKLTEATDYFLVDLPFHPNVTTRMMLMRCDLAIVASDYTLETLTGIKSVVNTLNFLGIPLERVGTIVTDPKGTFPEMELTNVKPYLEANLGVIVLGVIPYDTKVSDELSPNSVPVIISSPNCPISCSVKELAQQIIATEQTQKYSSRAEVQGA